MKTERFNISAKAIKALEKLFDGADEVRLVIGRKKYIVRPEGPLRVDFLASKKWEPA